MRKGLFLSLFVTVLAVLSLPFAFGMAESGKEEILITEEVLFGDPAEAAGITLKLPSHWKGQMLWDTEYTIGSSQEAKSSFVFSSRPVSWRAPETETDAGLSFAMGGSWSSTYADGRTVLEGEGDVHNGMINEVAGRTEKGEERTEVVRVGDYERNHPLYFRIEGHSVGFLADYGEACKYLKDFFHIAAAEDSMEITVEKSGKGEIRTVSVQYIQSEEDVYIRNVAADGGKGVYFVYSLVNVQTGEWADRGQNRGIFYFPYQEEKGFWKVDLTQVKKLCDFPAYAIPLQMQLDREEGILYLAVEEKEGYSLYVYRLEGEVPVLLQQVSGTSESSSGHPSFCRMSMEDGGILLTWADNSFAFFAEEKGQYRLWCSGIFPKNTEQEYGGTPFPEEQVCLFNGEKLILAAYESWRDMNVLLAVYDGRGLTYSGRYIRSKGEDATAGYDLSSRIAPQGVRTGMPGVYWRWGEKDKLVKPLEVFFRSAEMQ